MLLPACASHPLTPGRMASHPAGHMCVSYNGQCFSSEAWGGRSANRGQCAQQCRMPYGLMVDGALKEIGDSSRYLLSPQVGDLPISPHMSIPHGLRRPSPTLSPRLHNPWPSATFDDLRPPPPLSLLRISAGSTTSALSLPRACGHSRSRGGSNRPSTLPPSYRPWPRGMLSSPHLPW